MWPLLVPCPRRAIVISGLLLVPAAVDRAPALSSSAWSRRCLRYPSLPDAHRWPAPSWEHGLRSAARGWLAHRYLPLLASGGSRRCLCTLSQSGLAPMACSLVGARSAVRCSRLARASIPNTLFASDWSAPTPPHPFPSHAGRAPTACFLRVARSALRCSDLTATPSTQQHLLTGSCVPLSQPLWRQCPHRPCPAPPQGLLMQCPLRCSEVGPTV